MTHAQVLIQASGTTRAIRWVKKPVAPPVNPDHVASEAAYRLATMKHVMHKHGGVLKALAEYDQKGDA